MTGAGRTETRPQVDFTQGVGQRRGVLQRQVALHEAEPEHVVGEGHDVELLEGHPGQGVAQGIVLRRPRTLAPPRPRQAARACGSACAPRASFIGGNIGSTASSSA